MKRVLLAAILTLVLLVAGWFAQERLLGPAGSLEGPPTPPQAPTFRAIERSGLVERQRSPEAPWEPVAEGTVLELSDSLRTSSGGFAVLELGGDTLVRVGAESQVSVSEIRERASRIRLEEGQVTGDVIAEGARLEVSFRGTDAVAVASEGRFSAVNAGGGYIAVSSSSGSVELTAASQTVTVGPGEQSVVLPDLPPSAPRAADAALFLKLGRPPTSIQREPTTIVEGRTTPGTLLRAGDVRAVAGSDGRFSITVPLREGRNAVVVEALAPDGRQVEASLPSITVDSKPLDVTGTVKWK